MKATAAGLLYETLKSYGVDCIFGMEDPIHFFHAVDRQATRIVTMHDERHGAMMAHGYAQASGRPGVCAATYGPGAANLATGLLEAQRSSVPVIAIVQDHPLRVRNRHANSELDHQAAFAPYVKATIRIDFPDQAPDMVRQAYRIACSGRPGPVVLLCPTDVMGEITEGDVYAKDRFAAFPAVRSVAAHDDIAEAAQALAGASRPVIIAGGGAMMSGAFEEVRRLAERFGIPVATTLTGRGVLPDEHPLSLGAIGNQTGGKLGRGRIANAIVAEADLVFILGSKTGQLAYADWTLFAPGTRVLHLDIDAREIGRNFSTECALVGDARDTLRALLAHCDDNGVEVGRRDNGGRIAALKDDWRRDNQPYVTSEAVPIRPERLISEVNAVVDDSTIVVADGSYASGWVLSHIDVRAAQRTILSPRGTGSIGWGFAASLGAAMGAPDRTVICVNGDGGFYYALNELETAARYGIKVLTVILNNATLGFQRHYEEKALGSYRECDFLDIDFSAVARALGCSGERVTQPGDLAGALRRGLAHPGPYLIDAVIDPEVAAPIPGFERALALDTMLGH
ncbi:MAG: thiamine pyrophosphate-dependent enzyme [Rhodospirillaceae bacterium]